MKKRWKILLGVLAAVIVSCSVLAIYHRENIKALYYYLAYQNDDIHGRLDDNDRAIREAIDKIAEKPVRTLTGDEEALLQTGDLSIDDAVTLLTEPSSDEEADGAGEDTLAGLVAEAYVLRSYFTSSLESLTAQAAAEYNALPTEERTASAKGEIGLKYIGLGGSLENECDALMSDLISRIEAELAKTGGDTSVTAEIKSLYAEEKALRKAQYMSMYN